MNRTARDNRPNLKPVQKIELSEKDSRKKLILAGVLLLVGIICLGYALTGLLTKESDWTEIVVKSASDTNCGDDFSFKYQLGQGETSATAESKTLSVIYTDLCVEAYQLYSCEESIEGVNNINFINANPNKEIQVSDELYRAFELLEKYKNRNIYLGPIYEQYDDLFYCNDDSERINYDPFTNETVAHDYMVMAEYANNSDDIQVKLLGDNKIILNVSDEYLKYAKKQGIVNYIDFFWMKNSFIIDYIADSLIEKGYTNGTISSFDGYVRCLDSRKQEYSMNVFDGVGNQVYNAAEMTYQGPCSVVFLKSYILNQRDDRFYGQMDNGDMRTSYIDINDGVPREALENLIMYSKDMGCAEVLMNMIPVYICDEFDEKKALGLAEKNIFTIYCLDKNIYYNESKLKLDKVYDKDGVKYNPSFVIE